METFGRMSHLLRIGLEIGERPQGSYSSFKDPNCFDVTLLYGCNKSNDLRIGT